MGARPRSALVLELGLGTGAGASALLLAAAWEDQLPGLLSGLLIPAVLLYTPIFALLFSDRDFPAAGLVWPHWSRAGVDLLLVIGLVLPVFHLGFWALMKFGLGRTFAPHWPSGLSRLVLYQVLAVALPEEVFFRGWLQGRLDQLLPARLEFAGAGITPGLFIAAVLFALAHYLVHPRPVQLLVFFPGLLFGYLRARSGSVLVPILAHALSNIFFLVFQKWMV